MKLTKIDLENIRKNRLESHSIRRKILSSVFVIICTSLSLVYLIFFINPDVFWARLAFFVLVFADLFYFFSVLFIKRRRGLIAASIFTLTLIFKYFGITYVYYYAGLLGIGIITEIIITFRSH